MKIAVFPGTFDPITYGHVDIIKRAQKIFDKVIVAVACAKHKNTLFSTCERLNFIQTNFGFKNIEIVEFDGMLVDFCKKAKATTVIRGVRNTQDFVTELDMFWINQAFDEDFECVLFPTKACTATISSSNTKQIVGAQGDASQFTHPDIIKAMHRAWKIEQTNTARQNKPMDELPNEANLAPKPL